MFSQPMHDPQEEFSPIETGLEHVVSVLNDTWPCKAWLVLQKTPSQWKITHARDSHYELTLGDCFPEGHFEDFPLEAGVGCHFTPRKLPVFAQDGERELSIGGHIFHRILSQDGTVYGGILGIAPKELSKDASRAIPVISLLAELVMTTRSVCSDAADIGRRKNEIEREASRDKLTGVLNLRGWDAMTAKAIARFSRNRAPISLLALDLNDFKHINDTHGHLQGNEILKETARVVLASVRKGDLVARLGGDEFAIMALDTSAQGAQKMADSLEATLSDKGIACAIGVAEMGRTEPLEGVLERADLNMYARKRAQQNNGKKAVEARHSLS